MLNQVITKVIYLGSAKMGGLIQFVDNKF